MIKSWGELQPYSLQEGKLNWTPARSCLSSCWSDSLTWFFFFFSITKLVMTARRLCMSTVITHFLKSQLCNARNDNVPGTHTNWWNLKGVRHYQVYSRAWTAFIGAMCRGDFILCVISKRIKARLDNDGLLHNGSFPDCVGTWFIRYMIIDCSWESLWQIRTVKFYLKIQTAAYQVKG